MARAQIETELGIEIQCARCEHFWPADREFFFAGKKGARHSWCKACCYEVNNEIRAKKVRDAGNIGAEHAREMM